MIRIKFLIFCRWTIVIIMQFSNQIWIKSLLSCRWNIVCRLPSDSNGMTTGGVGSHQIGILSTWILILITIAIISGVRPHQLVNIIICMIWILIIILIILTILIILIILVMITIVIISITKPSISPSPSSAPADVINLSTNQQSPLIKTTLLTCHIDLISEKASIFITSPLVCCLNDFRPHRVFSVPSSKWLSLVSVSSNLENVNRLCVEQ